MLYAIAHFLRDKLPWIWDMMDLLNSWLFGLRYGRKLRAVESATLEKYGKEKLIIAAKFCTDNRLFSANTARDFLEFSELPKPEVRQIDKQAIPVDKPEYHVTVQKRSLDVYAKAGDM